jgi:hypothetical protein
VPAGPEVKVTYPTGTLRLAVLQERPAAKNFSAYLLMRHRFGCAEQTVREPAPPAVGATGDLWPHCYLQGRISDRPSNWNNEPSFLWYGSTADAREAWVVYRLVKDGPLVGAAWAGDKPDFVAFEHLIRLSEDRARWQARRS